MSTTFMHVAKFIVETSNREKFIQVTKDYEHSATQSGLDHSHLIEDEKASGTFWYVTVWANRDDWVSIEQTPAHKKMHKDRDALLAEPMKHDAVCGNVLS